MNEREFTLDEARAALAQARAPFEELRDAQRKVAQLNDELARLSKQRNGNGRGHGEDVRVAGQLAALEERSRELLGQVLQTGAEIKGLEQGLLDFPTTIDGEPAYWCWRAGEAEIEWWHPRDSGFAGRQRIQE